MHARGHWFEPQRRQYFKLLLDPGDFHSNPSGLLSFNKSETVLLWTIAKILSLLHLEIRQEFFHSKQAAMKIFIMVIHSRVFNVSIKEVFFDAIECGF